ncbi:unnamed protein product, partial [Coregonus sp. 'balchen']
PVLVSWVGRLGGSKGPLLQTALHGPARPRRSLNPNPRKKKPKYDRPLPSIHGEITATSTVGVRLVRDINYMTGSWLLRVTLPFYCDGECLYPLGSCMNATNHAMIQL